MAIFYKEQNGPYSGMAGWAVFWKAQNER